ncbi:MAG: YezD family protein [Candidatus Jettenia sp. CY-1]|nr:MAG: YezD family protein [Candidatus Jettenia sp. CY-1]
MEENLTSDKKKEGILITQILKAIKSIHFGYVQITVQNSQVIQIDKTEKVRLDGQRLPKPSVSNNS